MYSKVSQLYIHTDPPFYRFLSHTGHYRVLSLVPCALQQVLISYHIYFIYSSMYTSTYTQLIPHPCWSYCNHVCFLHLYLCLCFVNKLIKDMKVKVKSLSCVRLFATPWTVAYQAPLSMGFSRQEYWSGLPFPSPGDLPDPEIEPRSPAL